MDGFTKPNKHLMHFLFDPLLATCDVVLFFGFSVFMISEFGGTVALGGLVSATLLFAMLANLILLPSLLISLERTVSNEDVMKEPTLQILERKETRKSKKYKLEFR